ncbi:MAG: hypothetical protein JWL75_348 [Parcubacteria group bacterium]|nr:hypothetical protein [Parcubacteria group bacterium]
MRFRTGPFAPPTRTGSPGGELVVTAFDRRAGRSGVGAAAGIGDRHGEIIAAGRGRAGDHRAAAARTVEPAAAVEVEFPIHVIEGARGMTFLLR